MRGACRARAHKLPVVIAAGKHLFPFRTEKLSPPAPMVLGGQPPGRVGRRRIIFEGRPGWPSTFSGTFDPSSSEVRTGEWSIESARDDYAASARSRSRQSGSRSRSRADPLLDRRVRGEHRRKAVLPERAESVERLGRRAGAAELEQLHRLVEAHECVREAVRRLRRSLPLLASAASSRFGREQECTRLAAIGART